MFSFYFFKEYNANIGEHNRSPYDTSETNPVATFEISVDCKDIKWAEEQGIYPDRCTPPCRPRHQYRVKMTSIPMHQINHAGRRPGRITEMHRVCYYQLFQIDNIGDEKKIYHKEDDQSDIDWPFF